MVKKIVELILTIIMIGAFAGNSLAYAEPVESSVSSVSSVYSDVYSDKSRDGDPSATIDYGSYFEGFLKFVGEKYKDNVPKEKLVEYALKGVLSHLDNYSEFYSINEADVFFKNIEGNYSGIGVYISKAEDGSIIVEKVFNSTPAMKSGIIDGDRIVEVEGKSVSNDDADSVSEKIKGKAGTDVKLKILRGHIEREVTVTRSDVRINPVDYRIVDNVGYISLDVFNLNSSEEITNALNYMDSKGITKIVLDLRNNPGGEVNQVVDIAKHFVPKGLITKLDFKSPKEKSEEFYSELSKVKYKLVILVNKNSASASEILAGAVQDTQAGKIVGTVTYGKSRVQKLYPIVNYGKFNHDVNGNKLGILDAYELAQDYGQSVGNSDLFGWSKVTVGEYLTPNGRRIDKKGIDPDIDVEIDLKDKTKEDLLKINLLRNIKPLKKVSKYKVEDESGEVLQIERILKISGYDVDEPDAIFDGKTFKAIEKFQKDSGLFAYGMADFTTQEFLNNKLEALYRKYDPQYAKAFEVISAM